MGCGGSKAKKPTKTTGANKNTGATNNTNTNQAVNNQQGQTQQGQNPQGQNFQGQGNFQGNQQGVQQQQQGAPMNGAVQHQHVAPQSTQYQAVSDTTVVETPAYKLLFSEDDDLHYKAVKLFQQDVKGKRTLGLANPYTFQLFNFYAAMMINFGWDKDSRDFEVVYKAMEKMIKVHNLDQMAKIFGQQDPRKIAECYEALYAFKSDESEYALKQAQDYNEKARQLLQGFKGPEYGAALAWAALINAQLGNDEVPQTFEWAREAIPLLSNNVKEYAVEFAIAVELCGKVESLDNNLKNFILQGAPQLNSVKDYLEHHQFRPNRIIQTVVNLGTENEIINSACSRIQDDIKN